MALDLSSVFTTIATQLQAPEAQLQSTIDSLGSGSSLSVAQLTDLQFKMASFNLTGNAGSAIGKDFSDLMKQIVNRVG